MQILREIKADLVNPTIHLSDILRKAKVLAYQLQSEEMKSWVDMELDGYTNITKDKIPSYRKIDTQTFGHFIDPFGAELQNAPIAPASLPDVPKEYVTVFLVKSGIRRIETLITENDQSHRFLWPQNNVMGIGDQVYVGYQCVQAWWLVNNSHLEQILDIVRNRLLTFALEIEEQIVLGNDTEQTALKPTNDVPQIFNTIVMGGHTVIGVGRDLIQNNIQNIIIGDFPSLAQALVAAGLEKSDVAELEEAVKADEAPFESKSFGTNVKQWFGGMIQKAATGAWKISLDVATNLLTKALFQYYGWN